MSNASSQPSAPGPGATPVQGRRPHSPVEGFRPHTYIDGIYSLVNPQCGTAKNGKHFLKGVIRDATGEVPIRQWTFDEAQLAEISRTGFVWLGGQAQEYNGQLQVIVDSISAVEVELEDLARLLPSSKHDIPAMEDELRRILGSLAHPGMRALAECYLANEPLMARLRQAPAAVSVHHAWIGGLLEHTLQLMRIAEVTLPLYPGLNRDLVLMGLFLHDLGKTTELTWEKGFNYTAEGNLLGHTVKGAIMLSAMAARAARESGQRIPPEALLVLQHIVVSHHGSLEFGATKIPSTPEAIFVSNLDNLDAKTAVALHAAQRSRPIHPGQEFTERVWSLDTRIYRPDPLTWEGNGSTPQDV
jgi:3'-5' exoribonuclease